MENLKTLLIAFLKALVVLRTASKVCALYLMVNIILIPYNIKIDGKQALILSLVIYLFVDKEIVLPRNRRSLKVVRNEEEQSESEWFDGYYDELYAVGIEILRIWFLVGIVSFISFMLHYKQ